MKSTNRNKYLFKNTVIFAISNMSTKLITFFLIPLYTWKFSTSDFGIADLLFTICNFVYPLLTLNIVEAVFRFSMDKNIDEKKIVNLGLICYFICIVLGLTSIPIIKIFTSYGNLAYLFYLHLIFISGSQILLAFLKGQEKLKCFAVGNILNTLLVALFSVVLIVLFNMNITGYFLAYIFANILTILYVIIFGKINLKFSKDKIDKKLYKSMLKYSVVLMPTTFLWWIVNSSDKLMINHFIGSDAVGIYAISYKFPSLLTMIGAIFNQAWVFSAIVEKNSDDYEKYNNKVYNNLFLLLSLSAMALLIIIKPLLSFYVADEYFSAWQYVPYLTLGYIFMTLSTFISASYNVHKDSNGFLFSALAGAIANIILNFILIPIYGTHGAALATMISYIIIFIYRLIDTRKYVVIRYNSSQLLIFLAVLLSFALTYVSGILSIIAQIITLLFILTIYNKNIIDIVKGIIKR